MATQYKPILFSTEMVQAILEGRKTQTRRIIKPQPDFNKAWKNLGFSENKFGIKTELEIPDVDVTGNFLGVSSPIEIDGFKATGMCIPNIPIKIHKGDILWVRETWQTAWNFYKKSCETIYKADGGYWIDDDGIMKWKPSIYMPKEAARIFLEVSNVRVERLKDISEEDAIEEGIEIIHYAENILPVFRNYLLKEKKGTLNPRLSFRTLWEKINGEDSWNANPWVWVYEFKVVEKPKDFIHEH